MNSNKNSNLVIKIMFPTKIPKKDKMNFQIKKIS